MEQFIHPDRLNRVNSNERKMNTKEKQPRKTTKNNKISSTPKATSAATSEATSEATPKAILEATLEATSEAILEATSEATSEATPQSDFEDTGCISIVKGEPKQKKVKSNLNNMVLTIDVGIKNLAMCIMDSEYQMHLWDVYNMLDAEQYSYSCATRQKDGKPCEKKCQFKFYREVKNKVTKEISTVLTYSCKRHFPKDMPNQKKYFMKEKKVGDYLLQDIAERIMKGIQDIYDEHIELFKKVTHICIELQPKVNQRMKFTSHIIYAKFVDLYKDRDGEVPVRFIRASQNLQAYRGPPVECKLKTPYAKRKYLSVAYTKWYLEYDILNNEFNRSRNYLEFLLSHPKKDDLCDVNNANINVHKGLKKKQKLNKNGSEIK